MNIKTLAAVAAALASASVAQADTVSFEDLVPVQKTNWDELVSIGKFDTALGTLLGIKFELGGGVEGDFKFESLDTAPATVEGTLAAKITLTRPDASVLVVTLPSLNTSDAVAAFDGSIDFGGGSGRSYLNRSASDSDSLTSTSASDFALFSAAGGGTIDLPVEAVAQSTASGAGNLINQFRTFAGAKVSVTYTYEPKVTPRVPDTGSTALLLSLAGLGLFGARRWIVS